MLRAEDNQFLTESGAGTPMGELLRRFWLPVLLSEELPEADGAPKKILVMGEDCSPFATAAASSG
jgi:phthalate 4,5-dioxygenase oxygenase subunit